MKVSGAERQRVTTGCHCKECFGLAEVMIQMHGDDFGLERAPGHQSLRLHLVTTGPLRAVPCTGQMTCGCENCVGEREARAARAGAKARQPWEPRPSRSGGAPPTPPPRLA